MENTLELEFVQEVKLAIEKYLKQMDDYKGARFDELNNIHIDFYRNIQSIMDTYNSQKENKQDKE